MATTSTDAPPVVLDIADDLGDMLRAGRVCGGVAVSRVEYLLADGRRVAVDLPAPRNDGEEDDSSPPLSDVEQGILAVLARHPGQRLTASQIAPHLDEDEDPYGGTFKRAVSRLKLLDLIEGGKSDGGYRLKTKQK